MGKYLPVLILALIFGGLYYLRKRGDEIVSPDRPSEDAPGEPGAAAPGVVPADPAASGRITGLTLSVRVLMPDGKPLSRARVAPRSRIRYVVAAETDAEGRARFSDLKGGRYALHVGTVAAWLERTGLVNPEPIEIEPAGQEVVLRMLEGEVFEGVFRDREGRPVKDGQVVVGIGDWIMSQDQTDAAGRFLLSALPGRKLLVTASCQRGGVKMEGVTTADGLVEIRLGD